MATILLFPFINNKVLFEGHLRLWNQHRGLTLIEGGKHDNVQFSFQAVGFNEYIYGFCWQYTFCQYA